MLATAECLYTPREPGVFGCTQTSASWLSGQVIKPNIQIIAQTLKQTDTHFLDVVRLIVLTVTARRDAEDRRSSQVIAGYSRVIAESRPLKGKHSSPKLVKEMCEINIRVIWHIENYHYMKKKKPRGKLSFQIF